MYICWKEGKKVYGLRTTSLLPMNILPILPSSEVQVSLVIVGCYTVGDVACRSVCVCVVSIAMRRGWWWLWHVEAVSVRKQKKRVRVMKNRTIGLTTEPHLDPPIVVVTFGCCHDGVWWPYAQSCNNNARAFKKSWIKKNTPDASRAPCCCCGIWWQLLAQACK
jgi:hypothetical protein